MLVRELMTPDPVTVAEDTPVKTELVLITSTTVKSVPVVDRDGEVKGMLSRSDGVRVLARADEDLARDVDTLLESVGLGAWMAEVTDGNVTLTGLDDSRERALAHLVASTVPGVVQVCRD